MAWARAGRRGLAHIGALPAVTGTWRADTPAASELLALRPHHRGLVRLVPTKERLGDLSQPRRGHLQVWPRPWARLGRRVAGVAGAAPPSSQHVAQRWQPTARCARAGQALTEPGGATPKRHSPGGDAEDAGSPFGRYSTRAAPRRSAVPTAPLCAQEAMATVHLRFIRPVRAIVSRRLQCLRIATRHLGCHLVGASIGPGSAVPGSAATQALARRRSPTAREASHHRRKAMLERPVAIDVIWRPPYIVAVAQGPPGVPRIVGDVVIGPP